MDYCKCVICKGDTDSTNETYALCNTHKDKYEICSICNNPTVRFEVIGNAYAGYQCISCYLAHNSCYLQ